MEGVTKFGPGQSNIGTRPIGSHNSSNPHARNTSPPRSPSGSVEQGLRTQVTGLLTWTNKPKAASTNDKVVDAFRRGDAKRIYENRDLTPRGLWLEEADVVLTLASTLSPAQGAEVFARVGASLIDTLAAPHREATASSRDDGSPQGNAGPDDRETAEGTLGLFDADGGVTRPVPELGRLLTSLALGSAVRPRADLLVPQFDAIMRLFRVPAHEGSGESHLRAAQKEAERMLSEMAPDAPWKAWPIFYGRVGDGTLKASEKHEAAKCLKSAGEHFQDQKNFALAAKLYGRAVKGLQSIQPAPLVLVDLVGILYNQALLHNAGGRRDLADKTLLVAFEITRIPPTSGLPPTFPPNDRLVLNLKHELAKLRIGRNNDHARTLLLDAIREAETVEIKDAAGKPLAEEFRRTLATLDSAEGGNSTGAGVPSII